MLISHNHIYRSTVGNTSPSLGTRSSTLTPPQILSGCTLESEEPVRYDAGYTSIEGEHECESQEIDEAHDDDPKQTEDLVMIDGLSEVIDFLQPLDCDALSLMVADGMGL